MIHISRLITTCAIIHNLMIYEHVPLEWLDEDDVLDDAEDELNQVVQSDNQRRNQLVVYISNKFG